MNINPRGISRFTWLALTAATLAVGADKVEHLLSAHYQIDVTDQNQVGTIKSLFRIKPDDTVKLEVLPNYIQLTVHPVSEREYDLRMVITPKNGPAKPPRLDKTYRGQFGAPLELDATGPALQVSGAISIVVL